jgi:hyperosmotically inducible periplasmic protein
MHSERKYSGILVVVVLVQFLLAGCTSLTGETAGQSIDDTVLTSEVKAKLGDEKLVNTTWISVKTERGVVYLTGSVSTSDDRDKAISIAKNVKGVREVVDHLAVKP